VSREGPRAAPGEHLVLFDGGCGLCSRLVRFVARRDPAGVFAFASLQGAEGQAVLARAGAAAPPVDADTFVLVAGWRGGRPEVLLRARAALFVTARLTRPWRWLRVLRLLPAAWLDAGYRLVARHRRRLFAPPSACALPEPALRGRLLDP